MEDLKKYIKSTLGADIEYTTLTPVKLKILPAFLADEYDYLLIKLYRKDILLVKVLGSISSDKLKKHLEIIKNTFNLITVAVINQLESYTRVRLIEKRIPFIIPGKQMYLPDLLIDLKEFGNKPIEPSLTMQPAAQKLLLYHLQKETLEGINFKGISEKLYYNAMAVTRAAYYLHNSGICTLEGTKDKFLHFNYGKKELWGKMEPLMSSPIKKTNYYTGYIHSQNIYKSNLNALSFYTDLNDDAIEYYATNTITIKHIKGVNIKPASIAEANIHIEEWKYDPFHLADNYYVDPLSLYLCLRNHPDERIEIALTQLIEKIKW
jgi:hypothetical protein